ncbi:interferon-related developmental regulator 1 isoform X1 [Oryzias melastigma]|uniref:interferon-related developmental regulator 1 isoform X1 n=1 Tax=Oryzias melastigma TaxID=30732 RepID=UPI000CF808FA|nr:interferon-related developmental regulator 1 isoform X1 [Oryzias melastigma]
MPRTKKKNSKGGQHGAVQPFSDEDASIETLSHCSSFSDSTSVADEGGDGSEDTAQEDFQYKLKGFIDSTVDKSAKTRQGALDGLKTAMATRILYEFISERRMTITDSIERCLKKGTSSKRPLPPKRLSHVYSPAVFVLVVGKGEEQRAAASLACLLCIQLGSGIESEEVFKTLKPIFKNILADGSANIQARQAVATSLGLCTLVAEDDVLDVQATMECFENLFTRSYARADGTCPSINPQTSLLHTNALLSWALLLTICSANQLKDILHKHLPKLPKLLESEDVNMRIVAGETIALLFELARDTEPEFEFEDWDQLCVKLSALATDCNKHRAKNDKRKQRSVFRDVLKAVEDGDFQSETIRFGTERMSIDSWVRKRTYDAFREFVGSGMNYHLQANEFIRDVFELGPPILVDSATMKAMKISRFERHLHNSAAFKARTKARSKFRDKRVDVGEF